MFQRAIFRFLSSQYRLPSGFLGRYVGTKMDERNDRQSDWVISLLDLQNNDRVLDIGFATGRVLKKISDRITSGKLIGLDPSETMHQVASVRLKEEIQSGKVQLVKGFAENTPFSAHTFSKIFAVHVVYFWEDLDRVFKELFRISKSNALVAIYFVSPIISSNGNFHEYSEAQIKNAMTQAGFGPIQVKYKVFGKQKGVCVLGRPFGAK